MDEKNAKLLKHEFYHHIHIDGYTCAPCEGKGYLEAIEKAEGLAQALVGMVEMYVPLINSGDCGNWDPEEDEEVIDARQALIKWEKEK